VELNTVRASAPAGIVLIETLELLHPAFGAPIRITNQLQEVVATLEDSAPQNPGEVVPFQSVSFALVLPRAGDGGDQTIDITISNIGQGASARLEEAMASPGPITVIYRLYTSDDLSGPAEDPPTRLTLDSAIADSQKVVAKARNADNINRKFPSIIYNVFDHPGLAR
jgi:hypothetical protein